MAGAPHFPVREHPAGLLLPDGRLLEIVSDRDGLRLIGQEGVVHLTGRFADAILGRLPVAARRRWLTLLEHRHPWLGGLAQARLLGPGDAPRALARSLAMLFLELTARCQERCVHCYAESAPERTETLPPAWARRALEDAARLGARWVQFTGGDPLLHPEIVTLAAHARALGLAVEIFTNGLALRQGMLARLAPLGVRLSFSIYALDAAVHDAITRLPGSLARTLASLAMAREAGLDVRVGVVAMARNAHLLAATLEGLARDYSLPPEAIRVDFLRPVGRGVREAPAAGVRLLHLPTHTSTEGAKLCVAADGRVHPCVFARWLVLGHVREGLPSILARARARREAQGAPLACADCRVVARLLEAA